jgi:hypothetical protein
MHRLILSAALLLAAVPGPLAAPAAAGFSWPEGARAAVSLSYDDALDSQLDHAIPALDRAGLKGSFYLQLSNPAVARRMAEWRAAAARGHELGNHSLFHQCSRKAPGHEWVQPRATSTPRAWTRCASRCCSRTPCWPRSTASSERTYTVPCGDRLAPAATTCRAWPGPSWRSRSAAATA